MCEIVKVPWRLSRWRMERIVVKAPQAPARGSAQRRVCPAETFVCPKALGRRGGARVTPNY